MGLRYLRRGSQWAAALAAVGLCGAVWADALTEKADTFLVSGRAAAGWRSVIVRIDGDFTDARRAQVARLGGDVYRHLPIIQSVAVRVPARRLVQLASLPFVVRLSADVAVKKNDAFTVEGSVTDIAWANDGVTGAGVGIAIVDSGIAGHWDLRPADLSASRVVAQQNFVAGEASVEDACGHGTHVAGVAAGNGRLSSAPWNTATFLGIAPNASLINARVLNGNGNGNVSDAVAGISWVVKNQKKYNVRVLNFSAGHPVGESYTTDPLCQAVEAAWKAGIVVVCAAGNGGRLFSSPVAGGSNEGWGSAYGSIQSPGNDPYVITVGAMKNVDGNRVHDRIATYSSRGPTRLDYVMKPDIVAPGNRVISCNANWGNNPQSAFHRQ